MPKAFCRSPSLFITEVQMRIARFGSNAEERNMALTDWRQHEIWHFFINVLNGRLPSRGRKVLSEEAFSDVRIPYGYHNREPLDWSPLALRYVLLRQFQPKSQLSQ